MAPLVRDTQENKVALDKTDASQPQPPYLLVRDI